MSRKTDSFKVTNDFLFPIFLLPYFTLVTHNSYYSKSEWKPKRPLTWTKQASEKHDIYNNNYIYMCMYVYL